MLIVDKIWGGMFPSEDFIRGDREYFELLRETGKIEEDFSRQLSDEERKKLTLLLERNSDAGFLAQRDAFCFGVRIGAMLMIDVLCE